MMESQLNPHISIDCVVFGFSQNGIKVLLVERELDNMNESARPSYDLKLPGSLVYNDELLDDAASRVLKELTGIENIFLERFEVLDSLDRMKNQKDKEWLESTTGLAIDRVISVAYFGLVNLTGEPLSDLSDRTKWVAVELANKLPFDHSKIIHRARELLLHRAGTEPIAFDLLPEKFTIFQLQQVLEVFNGSGIDSRNFRKKLKTLDFIVPLSEKQINVAHKPAQLYKFDKKRFMQFRKQKNATFL
jgi:8-oxo-dGTP diphosphatase